MRKTRGKRVNSVNTEDIPALQLVPELVDKRIYESGKHNPNYVHAGSLYIPKDIVNLVSSVGVSTNISPSISLKDSVFNSQAKIEEENGSSLTVEDPELKRYLERIVRYSKFDPEQAVNTVRGASYEIKNRARAVIGNASSRSRNNFLAWEASIEHKEEDSDSSDGFAQEMTIHPEENKGDVPIKSGPAQKTTLLQKVLGSLRSGKKRVTGRDFSRSNESGVNHDSSIDKTNTSKEKKKDEKQEEKKNGLDTSSKTEVTLSLEEKRLLSYLTVPRFKPSSQHIVLPLRAELFPGMKKNQPMNLKLNGNSTSKLATKSNGKVESSPMKELSTENKTDINYSEYDILSEEEGVEDPVLARKSTPEVSGVGCIRTFGAYSKDVMSEKCLQSNEMFSRGIRTNKSRPEEKLRKHSYFANNRVHSFRPTYSKRKKQQNQIKRVGLKCNDRLYSSIFTADHHEAEDKQYSHKELSKKNNKRVNEKNISRKVPEPELSVQPTNSGESFLKLATPLLGNINISEAMNAISFASSNSEDTIENFSFSKIPSQIDSIDNSNDNNLVYNSKGYGKRRECSHLNSLRQSELKSLREDSSGFEVKGAKIEYRTSDQHNYKIHKSDLYKLCKTVCNNRKDTFNQNECSEDKCSSHDLSFSNGAEHKKRKETQKGNRTKNVNDFSNRQLSMSSSLKKSHNRETGNSDKHSYLYAPFESLEKRHAFLQTPEAPRENNTSRLSKSYVCLHSQTSVPLETVQKPTQTCNGTFLPSDEACTSRNEQFSAADKTRQIGKENIFSKAVDYAISRVNNHFKKSTTQTFTPHCMELNKQVTLEPKPHPITGNEKNCVIPTHNIMKTSFNNKDPNLKCSTNSNPSPSSTFIKINNLKEKNLTLQNKCQKSQLKFLVTNETQTLRKELSSKERSNEPTFSTSQFNSNNKGQRMISCSSVDQVKFPKIYLVESVERTKLLYDPKNEKVTEKLKHIANQRYFIFINEQDSDKHDTINQKLQCEDSSKTNTYMSLDQEQKDVPLKVGRKHTSEKTSNTQVIKQEKHLSTSFTVGNDEKNTCTDSSDLVPLNSDEECQTNKTSPNNLLKQCPKGILKNSINPEFFQNSNSYTNDVFPHLNLPSCESIKNLIERNRNILRLDSSKLNKRKDECSRGTKESSSNHQDKSSSFDKQSSSQFLNSKNLVPPIAKELTKQIIMQASELTDPDESTSNIQETTEQKARHSRTSNKSRKSTVTIKDLNDDKLPSQLLNDHNSRRSRTSNKSHRRTISNEKLNDDKLPSQLLDDHNSHRSRTSNKSHRSTITIEKLNDDELPSQLLNDHNSRRSRTSNKSRKSAIAIKKLNDVEFPSELVNDQYVLHSRSSNKPHESTITIEKLNDDELPSQLLDDQNILHSKRSNKSHKSNIAFATLNDEEPPSELENGQDGPPPRSSKKSRKSIITIEKLYDEELPSELVHDLNELLSRSSNKSHKSTNTIEKVMDEKELPSELVHDLNELLSRIPNKPLKSTITIEKLNDDELPSQLLDDQNVLHSKSSNKSRKSTITFATLNDEEPPSELENGQDGRLLSRSSNTSRKSITIEKLNDGEELPSELVNDQYVLHSRSSNKPHESTITIKKLNDDELPSQLLDDQNILHSKRSNKSHKSNIAFVTLNDEEPPSELEKGQDGPPPRSSKKSRKSIITIEKLYDEELPSELVHDLNELLSRSSNKSHKSTNSIEKVMDEKELPSELVHDLNELLSRISNKPLKSTITIEKLNDDELPSQLLDDLNELLSGSSNKSLKSTITIEKVMDEEELPSELVHDLNELLSGSSNKSHKSTTTIEKVMDEEELPSELVHDLNELLSGSSNKSLKSTTTIEKVMDEEELPSELVHDLNELLSGGSNKSHKSTTTIEKVMDEEELPSELVHDLSELLSGSSNKSHKSTTTIEKVMDEEELPSELVHDLNEPLSGSSNKSHKSTTTIEKLKEEKLPSELLNDENGLFSQSSDKPSKSTNTIRRLSSSSQQLTLGKEGVYVTVNVRNECPEQKANCGEAKECKISSAIQDLQINPRDQHRCICEICNQCIHNIQRYACNSTTNKTQYAAIPNCTEKAEITCKEKVQFRCCPCPNQFCVDNNQCQNSFQQPLASGSILQHHPPHPYHRHNIQQFYEWPHIYSSQGQTNTADLRVPTLGEYGSAYRSGLYNSGIAQNPESFIPHQSEQNLSPRYNLEESNGQKFTQKDQISSSLQSQLSRNSHETSNRASIPVILENGIHFKSDQINSELTHNHNEPKLHHRQDAPLPKHSSQECNSEGFVQHDLFNKSHSRRATSRSSQTHQVQETKSPILNEHDRHSVSQPKQTSISSPYGHRLPSTASRSTKSKSIGSLANKTENPECTMTKEEYKTHCKECCKKYLKRNSHKVNQHDMYKGRIDQQSSLVSRHSESANPKTRENKCLCVKHLTHKQNRKSPINREPSVNNYNMPRPVSILKHRSTQKMN